MPVHPSCVHVSGGGDAFSGGGDGVGGVLPRSVRMSPSIALGAVVGRYL